MAVKVFLILFVTLQAIFHSSATPIDLDIKTVHGDVSAKECHGFQACIGHRLTKVDTINGDLHATEHYNARPGATASATASAGRRRRNINSHQQQNSSETILQTVNGVINGKYAPAPDNEQCLCANNKPGSWICKLGRSFGQDCRCECRPFSVYEPDNLLSIRQKRSPINLRVGTVRGTTSYKRCTSEHPCGGKSPTIDVGHVGGTVIHEVIENGETTIHETIGNNNADQSRVKGYPPNRPGYGSQPIKPVVPGTNCLYSKSLTRFEIIEFSPILGSTECQDIWPVNECRSRKQKNNCIPQRIRTNCPVTCGLCGGNHQTIKVIGDLVNRPDYESQPNKPESGVQPNQPGPVSDCQDLWPVNECISRKQKNNCIPQRIRTNCPLTCGLCGGNHQTIKVIGEKANGSEVTRYHSGAAASVAVRGGYTQNRTNQNSRVTANNSRTQGTDAMCYDIWQPTECQKRKNTCNNRRTATNCRRTCGFCS